MLSKEVRPYYGVNISKDRKEEGQEIGKLGGWDIWEINMMGLTDLPYHAYQAVKRAN